MQPLIRLEGVTKKFLTDEVETHALAGIHLNIHSGEWVSISGPSGCGKSTLLSILGLLDSPSDGSYWLNEKPVDGLKMGERSRIRNREIGFIFQAFNLIGDLTVYENVELPLTYRSMPGPDRKKRVNEALERVAMSHRSFAAFRRPAAARGRRPRAGWRSAHPVGRRADREPGFAERGSGDHPVARAASLGRHHLHGDP
jgi:ABC-type lipoprotein export system ATPase subunit